MMSVAVGPLVPWIHPEAAVTSAGWPMALWQLGFLVVEGKGREKPAGFLRVFL